MKQAKQDYLAEYRQLCEKYRLYIDLGCGCCCGGGEIVDFDTIPPNDTFDNQMPYIED